MALYECVWIARQDISTSQAEQLSDQFAEVVTSNGGQVTKKEYWGLRTLSYKIKKNRKGHYTLFNLDCPPAALNELQRLMGLNEDVLRHLAVRVEELEEGPSVQMQARGERRGRGERGERGDRGDRGDRGGRGPRHMDDSLDSADEGEE